MMIVENDNASNYDYRNFFLFQYHDNDLSVSCILWVWPDVPGNGYVHFSLRVWVCMRKAGLKQLSKLEKKKQTKTNIKIIWMN